MKQKLFYGYCFLFLFWSLQTKAQPPRLVLPIGHTGTITDALFSPDGKKVLTAADDNSAKLWDANTGSLLAHLRGHSKSIHSASFSPDGSKIVTVAQYESVRLWDAGTGNLLAVLTGKDYLVSSATFSPDGKKILTTGIDVSSKPIKFWDASTGELLAEPKLIDYSLSAAHFSQDGKKILTVATDSVARVIDAFTGEVILNLLKANTALYSTDGNKVAIVSDYLVVKVLDAHTGKVLLETKGIGHQFNFVKARFSPDGEKIVVASEDSVATVWNISSQQPVARLKGHSYGITAAMFSPDGKKIITASGDRTAKLWDAGSGKLLASLDAHEAGVNAVQFSPDGRKVVTASEDYTAKVWDVVSGKLTADLKGHTYWISSARLTPDDQNIFVASENSIKKWNMFSGATELNLAGRDEEIVTVQLSQDGKTILAAYNSSFYLLDAATGEQRRSVKTEDLLISAALLSPDGKKVLTLYADTTIATVWNTVTGKPSAHLKVTDELFNEAKFSPDGNRIIVYSYLGDDYVRHYDALTGKQLHKLSGDLGAYSPDGKKIVTTSLNSADVWDASTGKSLGSLPVNCQLCSGEIIAFSKRGNRIALTGNMSPAIFVFDFKTGDSISVLNGHTASVNTVQFSPDGNRLVTASADGTARVWDAVSGQPISKFDENVSTVASAQFSNDGKKILTVSGDNTICVWDVLTGKMILRYFTVDQSDNFIQVPAGYYQTTPAAAKLLHYVSKNLKVITFEQLDVKYNRPDKVLEAIGNTDTALINSYRKAWEKRIKKLGIDTTQFRDGYSVPEADFVNRDNIDYEQKTGTLRLHIKGIDSIYKLDRFNVWVNESPLFGQRGISVKKKNNNSIDTTITIQLSQGENRIETSITNVNGTESYRMPLYVNYTPAVKQKEMTRFIGIGIDQFKDSKHNLQYSSKDIRDLAVKLKEKYKDNIIIDTLFNENVTTEKVKALKEKLQQTTVNDKVIISYSGHGLLSKDYDYYLSTYSVNFSKPEENGLPYDELESLLDSIPARKKLLLIDACHSGEVDKEEGIAMNKLADSLGLTKGIIIDQPQQQQHVGLKNSFELMQSLFVNVGKSTGATIISAAAGNQFALERGDLKNGVFTYSLLEAMNQYPTIKISELKKIVGERVEQLTNGLQKPTSRNENIAVDWSLW